MGLGRLRNDGWATAWLDALKWAVVGVLAFSPAAVTLGDQGDMVFANLHYVDPYDDFEGLEVSFFAMNQLDGRVGRARAEAYVVEIVDGSWTFIPRGVWELELTSEEVIPAGSEGFFEPRYPMIRLDLAVSEPRPYEHSIFVVTVTLNKSEIEEERIFPNVWEVAAEADASLVDMGDGQMTPGLQLQQLTALLPNADRDPDAETDPYHQHEPDPSAQASRHGRFTAQAAPVKAGTHIVIHAHPQMGQP